MAVTNLVITSLAANEFQDTDNRVVGTAAVTVKGSAGTLYLLSADNTANGAQVTYVKLYDSAGVITVGVTAPDWVFKVTAGITQPLVWAPGIAFSAGLQVVSVTTGGTAGTTANGSAVIVRIGYS